MKLYEWNLSINDTFVRLRAEEGKEPVLQTTGILDANELAAVACVTQTLRCLTMGRHIGHNFNPTVSDEDRYQLVKCRWERSGKLKEIGPTDKKFHYAENVEAAMCMVRIFTCTRMVLVQLPRRRQGQLK